MACHAEGTLSDGLEQCVTPKQNRHGSDHTPTLIIQDWSRHDDHVSPKRWIEGDFAHVRVLTAALFQSLPPDGLGIGILHLRN